MLSKCNSCHHEPTNVEKWKYTILTTILFLIVVNPLTYKVVNGLLKNVIGKVANRDGCPTELGIIIHSVVFTLLLRLLMEMNI